MRIEDEKLLARMKQPGLCEYCGRPCVDGRDPHHLHTKASGRLDIKENLASLCRECHNGFHNSGKPSFAELLSIVAEREGMTPEEIVEKVHRLRRTDLCETWVVS
jgi:5-methylcytosine-specific restriction endonuclease McrA